MRLKYLVQIRAVERVRSPFHHDALSPLRSDIRVKLPAVRPFFKGMSRRARMLGENDRYPRLPSSGEKCADSVPYSSGIPDWWD